MDDSSMYCAVGAIVLLVGLIVWAVIAGQQQKEKREDNLHVLHDHLRQIGFVISNSFKWGYLEVVVDTQHQMFEILDSKNCKYNHFDFREIVDCETIEDGNIIASGGVGRAIVGGLLFGGAGAIVGAATRKSKAVITHLAVKITRSDISNPLFMVNLINGQTETNSGTYLQAKAFADQLQATCTSIIKMAPQAVYIAPTPAPALAPMPAQAAYARLTGIRGEPAGRVFALANGTTIGRASGNSIRLLERDVSRQHAVLRCASGRWFIQDQKSAIGMYVNGARVGASALQEGDHIRIGQAEFEFHG